jgi:hypothetical protein
MIPRKNIQDKFTTFLSISEDSNGRYYWVKDPELVSNFRENCLQEYSEELLVLYFLNQAKQDNSNLLALRHLAAYLEETIYSVAEKEYNKFTNKRFSVTDCWQEARKCTHDHKDKQFKFKEILDKFNPERGSLREPLSAKLKKFYWEKMANRVFLFLRMGVEKAKYSDAVLLKSISKIYLKESLQQFGIYELQLRSLTETSLKQALEKVDTKEPKLSQCLLAWTCFTEIDTSHDAEDNKIKDLTSKQLKVITNRYKELADSRKLSASISGEELQVLLQICEDSARQNTLFFKCELAWICYNEICKPKQPSDSNTEKSDAKETIPKKEKAQKKLKWLSQEKLEQITNRYNQLIFSPTLAINSQELDSLLKTCVKALRTNISNEISPPNVEPSYITPDGEELDIFERLSPNNLLFNDGKEVSLPPLAIEHDEQLKKIKSILIDSFSKLPKYQQKMLQLELGLSITQTDIADALNIDQPKVCKELKIAKKVILKNVVDIVKMEVESEKEKFNSIISDSSKGINPKDIENISTIVIDDCLKPYLTSHFSEILKTYFPSDDSKILQIFRLRYGKEEGKKIPLDNIEEQKIIDDVKRELCSKLSKEVQKDFPKPLNERESANQKILKFVNEWLKSAPYVTFGN